MIKLDVCISYVVYGKQSYIVIFTGLGFDVLIKIPIFLVRVPQILTRASHQHEAWKAMTMAFVTELLLLRLETWVVFLDPGCSTSPVPAPCGIWGMSQ